MLPALLVLSALPLPSGTPKVTYTSQKLKEHFSPPHAYKHLRSVAKTKDTRRINKNTKKHEQKTQLGLSQPILPRSSLWSPCPGILIPLDLVVLCVLPLRTEEDPATLLFLAPKFSDSTPTSCSKGAADT